MWPMHIIESNLLYSEPTDLNANHISKKLPLWQHLYQYLNK